MTRVRVQTQVYALSTQRVANCARLTEVGSTATLVRHVDANAAIVRFFDGLVAPVHPSALELLEVADAV